MRDPKPVGDPTKRFKVVDWEIDQVPEAWKVVVYDTGMRMYYTFYRDRVEFHPDYRIRRKRGPKVTEPEQTSLMSADDFKPETK